MKNKKEIVGFCVIIIVILMIFMLLLSTRKNTKDYLTSANTDNNEETVYEVYNEKTGLYELRYTDTDKVIDYYETKEDVDNIKEFYDSNPGYYSETPSSPNVEE